MNILNKIEFIKRHFGSLPSREVFYQEIMEWGKKLSPFQLDWKREENKVVGCQSLMYLHTACVEGKVFFHATSDALISAGLAALLIEVYSGEPPEAILLTPPTFLEELGIPSLLTPGRANGLASLHLKMKQAVIQYLVS